MSRDTNRLTEIDEVEDRTINNILLCLHGRTIRQTEIQITKGTKNIGSPVAQWMCHLLMGL